jgi:transcription initiation factor TFIIE subunit alpha
LPKKKRKTEERKLKLSPREKYYFDILLKIVEKMYGRDARRVLEYMVEKNGVVAEETLGRELGIKSNEARKIVQRLADEAIVRHRTGRIGDKTYHLWILNTDQLEGILIARLRKTREKLVARLNYEKSNTFLICPTCGRRYTLDEAFDNDFKCPFDNTQLVEYDNSAEIRFLEEKIREIDEELRKIGVSPR